MENPTKETENENSDSKIVFEIAVGEDLKPLGKIQIILFDDVVPKTAANFRALASGNFL
jgi:hypothetical protein